MRLDELRQDVVVALRALRATPSYTLVVVLTLALGIAANSLIFSFMNPYLVRELPFADAERLVQLGQVDPVRGYDQARFSLPQFEDWKERSEAFEDLAAYYYGVRNLTGDEGPEQVVAGLLTANVFDVLGVEARLGRTFLPDEDGPSAERVVVLRDGLWRRRYGADPSLVGRTILIDGEAHTVVGIMPPEFNFPFGGVRMWLPIRESVDTEPRERTAFLPVGRLADGWSRERAGQELEAIQSELGASYPRTDGVFAGVNVQPLRAALNFGYDIMIVVFTVLLVAVGFVLLIACANVASLTMARMAARSREVAVRSALGAGRGRIVRQLLTESVLLAGAGGLLGMVAADTGVRYLGPMIPEDIFRVGEFTLDANVLLFSMAVTLATPLLFGLAPALGLSRTELVSALREGARGSVRSLAMRRALVIGEIAMAIVLIGGTGLMLRSFVELQRVDTGFDESRVLTVMVNPPEADYPETEDVESFYDRGLDAVRGLPGIAGVGLVQPLPMNHSIPSITFAQPGHVPVTAEEWPLAHRFTVSPGYFDAMDIGVLTGRAFEETDRADAPPVVIVNRTLAEAYWPGESPVGETLLVGKPEEATLSTVVGVVADVTHDGFENSIQAQIYRPLRQNPYKGRFFVVATEGPPSAAAGSIRTALAEVDPNVPLSVRPMTEIVAENALQWSIGSLLLGVFGLSALILASLGIYGVVAYSVAERRREIGIRMAVGATATDVRRVIVGEGLRLTAVGVGIGLVLSLALSRLMASVLFGVSAFDPLTFTVVIAAFAAVALGSSAIPARQASRTSPVSVLRCD